MPGANTLSSIITFIKFLKKSNNIPPIFSRLSCRGESSIQFKNTLKNIQKQTRKSSVDQGQTSTRKMLQKKALKTISAPPRIDYVKIGSCENQANLLGTRSSLEIIKEKGSVKKKSSKRRSMQETEKTSSEETSNDLTIICEDQILNSQKSFESIRIIPEKQLPIKPTVPQESSKEIKGNVNGNYFSFIYL